MLENYNKKVNKINKEHELKNHELIWEDD